MTNMQQSAMQLDISKATEDFRKATTIKQMDNALYRLLGASIGAEIETEIWKCLTMKEAK